MSTPRTAILLALVALACGEEDPGRTAPPEQGCDAPVRLYFDADGDGYGVESLSREVCDAPPGFVETAGDCDDISPEVHPGAQERCNQLDDDCDGTIDPEGTPGLVWSFADADGDGHGGEGTGSWTCDLDGRVEAEDDCDDAEPLAWTGADEICGDGVDNDCDGDAGGCGLTAGGDVGDLGFPIVDSDRGKVFLGASVASADLTGDGVPDLVSGAPEWGDTALGVTGAIDIQVGPLASGSHTSGEEHLVYGPDPALRFGAAVVAGGDLDGDGYEDVLVGAPLAPNPSGDGGLVFPVFGPVTTMIGEATGTGRYVPASVEQVGTRLVVGDFAGDGTAELLASAVRASDGAELVVVVPDGTSMTPVSSRAELLDGALSITGPSPTAGVGRALSAIGDLDGDGQTDFAIGAPSWTDTSPRGAVAVFLGVPTADTDLSAADHLFLGGDSGKCGGAVASGDVDGDGSLDVGVACGAATIGQTGRGGVLLFLGPAAPTVGATDADASISEDASDETLAGSILMGDLDGDGLADLAATRHPGDRSTAAVLMWSAPSLSGALSADDATRAWTDRDGGASDGTLALDADLTGDGAPDLVAGWSTWPGTSADGRVVIIPAALGL